MVLLQDTSRYLSEQNLVSSNDLNFSIFHCKKFDNMVFVHMKQPMIYGRGPMPAGMQMVPMVLPDGRIGYVL